MSAEPSPPATPAPTSPPPRVLVEEAPLPRRVRRPRDLLRAVGGLLLVVVVVLVGSIGVGTATGLEQDLVGVTGGAPRVLLQLVNFVASAGVLLLPFVAALDLVLRRRAGQILDAVVGAAVCVLVTTSIATFVTSEEPARVLEALTKVLPDGSRSQSLNHVVAAVVAFLVVADLAGRTRLRAAAWLTVGAVVISAALSGRVTLLSVVVSLLIGWTVGTAVRYAFGSFSTRPDGRSVAAALNMGGLGVTSLAEVVDRHDGARTYLARSDDGRAYDVVVLDRDLEGAGVLSLAWRQLQVIAPAGRRRAVSVRATLEHDALASYAVVAAGVRTPRLAFASEVGDDAAVLAYEHPRGRRFSELDESEVTDAVLTDVWSQHELMLRARIAHRGLNADRLLVRDDERTEVVDLRYAVVAASDLQLRLDTTELLVTLALTVGSERAVHSAILNLGSDDVAEALPLLQPLALTPTTRRAVRHGKGVLRDIRDQVIADTPSPPAEPAQLQRVNGRTLLSVAGLGVAAYFLLTQLTQVNLGSLFDGVDWRWAAVAAFLAALTYLGATLSYQGFVLEPISFIRTLHAQIAGSFVKLFAPAALGGAALNARYLERSGLEPALAVATVGLSQLMALIVHLSMLLVFGVLAGQARETDVTPSQDVVVIAAVVLAAATVFLLLPIGRRILQEQLRPMVGRVVPRLFAVLQRPFKLAVGISGNLILNLSFIFCLVASVRAFGGEANVAAIAVVFLAGAAVGSIVPTPGGIGAIEAALAAGVTAAGVDGGVAVSAVLFFRILTFWIPIAPGWLSFTYLQRKGYL